MSSRPGGEVRTWLDEFNSPLIQEDGNSKCLKLRFDVSQYAPEEIVVKTVDNKLLVSVLFRFRKSKLIVFVCKRYTLNMKKSQNQSLSTESTIGNSFCLKEQIQNKLRVL